MSKICSVCKKPIENDLYIKMQATLHSGLDDQEKGTKHTHIIHLSSFNQQSEHPKIYDCLKKYYEEQLLIFKPDFNKNVIEYVENMEKVKS